MIDDVLVPLALYAAVVAALGEGYPLAVVLEHEGLPQDTWEAADERWVDRLGASAEGDLSLFDGLDRALAAARARFARPVDPLDDDLEQFLAFKSHLAAAERPIAMLAEHGLFLGDWVRLQERWAGKLGADSSLRTKAAMGVCASEAPPLPVVRPSPRALPPAVRPRRAAPVGVTPISSGVTETEPVEWGLSIFRDAPRIHEVQHIDREAASLAKTDELPPFAEELRAMAENPLPFRAPLPFKTDAPYSAQTPPQPKAVGPRVSPAGATTPKPPLSPAAKPPRAPEITADISAAVQELLHESAERPLPFSSPAAPSPQPSLTLEQYAQLCLQMVQDPARAVEIRARYGLADDSAWVIVHRRWQDRIHRDPELHRRWLELTAPTQAHK